MSPFSFYQFVDVFLCLQQIVVPFPTVFLLVEFSLLRIVGFLFERTQHGTRPGVGPSNQPVLISLFRPEFRSFFCLSGSLLVGLWPWFTAVLHQKGTPLDLFFPELEGRARFFFCFFLLLLLLCSSFSCSCCSFSCLFSAFLTFMPRCGLVFPLFRSIFIILRNVFSCFSIHVHLSTTVCHVFDAFSFFDCLPFFDLFSLFEN